MRIVGTCRNAVRASCRATCSDRPAKTGIEPAGFRYDPAQTTLTSNVGAISVLDATITEVGAVVDELYWKQVAWNGHLVLMGGKIDFAYHFDSNRIANDAFSEFFAYPLQNNPSIPAPLFGGFGGIIRANLPGGSYVMLGVGDSSMDAPVLPWETLDHDSRYEVLELGVAAEWPSSNRSAASTTAWRWVSRGPTRAQETARGARPCSRSSIASRA